MTTFTIVETAEYRVEAASAQEALELWLDKGEETADWLVTEHDVLDETGNPCEVEER